jgi:hypothetical protein
MCHEISLLVFFFLTLQTGERRAIPQSLYTPGGKKYSLWIFFPLQLRLYDDDDDGAVQILFPCLCWKLNSVSRVVKTLTTTLFSRLSRCYFAPLLALVCCLCTQRSWFEAVFRLTHAKSCLSCRVCSILLHRVNVPENRLIEL